MAEVRGSSAADDDGDEDDDDPSGGVEDFCRVTWMWRCADEGEEDEDEVESTVEPTDRMGSDIGRRTGGVEAEEAEVDCFCCCCGSVTIIVGMSRRVNSMRTCLVS